MTPSATFTSVETLAGEGRTRAGRLAALVLAFVVLLIARDASAINQPDGTPIPATMGLQSIFTARGESIDALRDAGVTPERFVPGCRLTFTLVSRGPATFRNSFGWYNVTGSAPAESDLHVLIPCDAPQGTVATLDLSREPAYRGGEIAFFLRTPEDGSSGTCSGGDCCGRVGHPGRTYYSERRFNPDSVASGGTGYIHLLTYDSRATRDAFYFAWEDLFRGGDNNFTDFVALVSNIVCSGAGAPCSTGMRGVCGQGVQQCRAGMLACVPTIAPSAERCDGVDNDCNGTTDDGMGLCPRGEVCDRGVCVPPCLERACFVGFRCTDRGTCVEDACVGVMCNEGQRCESGRCVGVCDGIRCPIDQVCRAGRCVDGCAGVTCDSDQVCVGGTCVPRCQCRRCAASETCQADGRCVPTSCAMISCATGQRCVSGACRDACDGAVCPRGERCVMGACVAEPAADGGASSDAATDSGATVMDSGGSPGDSGAAMDVATDVRRPSLIVDGGNRGCGCRVLAPTRAGANGRWALAMVLLALAAAIHGRRQ